jgi:hypothetical protein
MANHRQFDEPTTVILRIRVTPAQRRDLEQVARDNRDTVSGVIREAVNEFAADYRENRPVFPNRRTPAQS